MHYCCFQNRWQLPFLACSHAIICPQLVRLITHEWAASFLWSIHESYLPHWALSIYQDRFTKCALDTILHTVPSENTYHLITQQKHILYLSPSILLVLGTHRMMLSRYICTNRCACWFMLSCKCRIRWPFYLSLVSIVMARGKALSQDTHWVIIWMHHALTITEVMHYTGLKHQTIEQVLALNWNTGTVSPQSHQRWSMAGWNQILNGDEISVSVV